jgi:predicted Ser/Thr protein kinase
LLPQGTIVSGYRVDGVLGEGGMGVVYRATQLSLNRTVALKILATELSQDDAFRERFRREGLLQAAIDHEHIVTVYEAGDTEHGLFLAMRLIRGPTLKDMILAGELDPRRALRILGQVSTALDTAHDVGLTHRDIKPQNILISGDDHAYLADFGLTQASDEVSLTETGQFIGTIDYVAPEQVQGQGATAQSDVYSLTAVLYEALTGFVPFLRQNEAAVLYAHISEPPPKVTEKRSEFPPAIDAVVERGMAKAPADRYASAGALIADARAAFGDQPAAATTIRPQAPAPGAPGEIIPAGERTVTRRTQPAGAPAAATTLRGAPAPAAATAPAGSPTVDAVRPAAATAPGAAAPSAPAARRGIAGGAIALIAVLGLAAVAAGYVLGSGGDDSTDTSAPLTNSASAGAMELSFPSGWKRVSGETVIPGVRFRDPIVLAAGTPRGARLVAGQVNAAGSSLLHPRLIPDSGAPEAQPVRLGKLNALYYDSLQARGVDGKLRLYAVPTSEGVATVACVARPGAEAAAFNRDCESVATTLRVTGAKVYPLGPRPEYAASLKAALARLERASKAPAATLKNAATREAQAAAASDLAAAYTRGAQTVQGIETGPAERGANGTLASALLRTAAAYTAAAKAARAGNEAAYASASRDVQNLQRVTARSLRAFEDLGYDVS